MTTPDLNEINANIQSMKQAAEALDQLGEDFLQSVNDGDWIVIGKDGTVTVEGK